MAANSLVRRSSLFHDPFPFATKDVPSWAEGVAEIPETAHFTQLVINVTR